MKKGILYSILIALIISSCGKDDPADVPSDPTDTTGNVKGDSIYLIERIAQPYSWSTTFKYNASNRLISYGRYSSNFDTTTITYNSSGKPIGVVHYTGDSFSEHMAQPSIFIYQGDKLQKIITKYPKAKGSYPADYFTSYDKPLEILGFDSIVYNSKKQIVKTLFYQLGYGTPDTTLWEYKLLSYFADKDSLLQKIESYYRDVDGSLPLNYSVTFHEYDTKPNPFYNLVPHYAFLHYKTNLWILSHYYAGYYGSDFLTASPHNCISTSANFNNIKYFYNADSLPVRSMIGNDDLEAVNYIYTKVKK